MAKKEPKLIDLYPSIIETTPWFWRTCSVCSYRFRFQKVWRSRQYFYGDSFNERFACKECCPTRKDFDEHLHPSNVSPPTSGSAVMSPKPQLPPVRVIREDEAKPLKSSTKRSRFKEIELD